MLLPIDYVPFFVLFGCCSLSKFCIFSKIYQLSRQNKTNLNPASVIVLLYRCYNKHILLKFASLLPKQNQLKFGFCSISCKIWNYGLQSARFELIDLNTRGRSSGYIFSFICWLLKKPFVDRSQSSFKSCLTPTGKSNYKWQIRPQRSTKQTRRGRNPGSRHGPVRNKERTKKFPKLCYRLRDRVWPKTESKRRTQTQLSTET